LLDGTVWVLLAEALFPITGLVTAAFLTRRLGPDGYGLWVLAVSLVVWVEWSLASFFSRATIKHVGEAQDWRPLGTTAVQLQLRMGIGAMAAIWILALPLAQWLNEPSLAAYLALLALDIPLFALAQAHRQILAGTGAYRECAWAGGGRWLSRLLFVVLLVTAGLSVVGAILGIIGSTVLELWLYRQTLRPALFSRTGSTTWSLWSYSWPLFLSTVSLMVVGRMDLFAVKALGYTAEEAGLYGAAQNLALLPTLLGMAATPLFLSSLSRALARGDTGLARAMTRHAMRIAVMTFPFAAAVAGSAEDIAQFLFGMPFRGAGRFLPLLIFGAAAILPLSVALTALTADAKPRMTFALTGPLVPLAMAGHAIAVPRYGPFGASLVTVSIACIGMAAGLVSTGRLWRVGPPPRTIVRTLAASMLAMVVSMAWPASGAMVFVKLFAVTGLILVVYWALREFPADEMALFREVIRGWTGTSRTADNTEAGAPPEAPLPSERNVRRGTLAP
jgi:O-antigen/teichoic acid export membrane protein